MSTDEIILPIYYIVGRHLPEAQIYAVRQALSITPISCVIVSDIRDVEYARTIYEAVVRVSTDEDAFVLAQQLDEHKRMPALIIGDADILDAYYADGSKEKIV